MKKSLNTASFAAVAASEVALWMVNDEAIHERWTEQAIRTLARFNHLDTDTAKDAAASTLAEMMKHEVLNLDDNPEGNTMEGAVMIMANEWIDWMEIAELYVETAIDTNNHTYKECK